MNADVQGLLSDLKGRTFSDKVKLTLDANVTALEAGFKGDEKTYSVESCSISAREREIEVHNLVLKRGSSDIKLNGKMPGVFNYLADRTAPLVIHGNLFSNYIKLEDFIPNTKQSGQGNDNPLIPANVEFKLNAAILKFSFAKFEAQSITGQVEIKNQKAIISGIKLQTMEGDADISAYADNSANRLEVVLQSNLSNINITNLFTAFNNFGQTTMRDENIKGYVSANIAFSGTWNNRLEADLNTIKATSSLSIGKGELVDFVPLIELSKYIEHVDSGGLLDIKRMMSLSKFIETKSLKDIKFSSLQCAVEIKNGTIFIPRTSLKNTTLNMDVSGTHSFNNDIDYHLQLLKSEIKAKKQKSKQSEFGPLEIDPNDKSSVFIRMVGKMDSPKITYDIRGMKEKIKNDIKEERQNLRQLLKEEIGLFKKRHDKKGR